MSIFVERENNESNSSLWRRGWFMIKQKQILWLYIMYNDEDFELLKERSHPHIFFVKNPQQHKQEEIKNMNGNKIFYNNNRSF